MADDMMSGDRVERFKLTKGQMEFQKEFGAIQKVKRMLQGRMLMIGQQVQNIRELFSVLNEREASIQAPTMPTHEAPGMAFTERQQQ